VVVHPGYYAESNIDVENLGLRDYAEYDRALSDIFEEYSEQDKDIYVLSRKNELEYTREFLGDRSDQVEGYIETSRLSGLPNSLYEADYSEIFAPAYSDIDIEIWGELNGLCYSQFRESAEDIATQVHKEVSFSEGRTFPKEELTRTDNVIHWKDEEPDIDQKIVAGTY